MTAPTGDGGRSDWRRARGPLVEIIETIVLTALIFVGIQTFVAQPFEVRMGSMERTLLANQYVLVDKLTPRWEPFERGDIVVFAPPPSWSSDGTPLIKRVIGVPGDTVELVSGRVRVNGVPIDEPYVYRDADGRQPTEPGQSGLSQWVVPEGQLLVFGDHRGASADSRDFGPIDISEVVGRAWLRYWPVDAFGVLPEPEYPGLLAP